MALVRLWVHHGADGADPRDRPHVPGPSCTCRPTLMLVNDTTGQRFPLETFGPSWRCFTPADLARARAEQNAAYRAALAAQKARGGRQVGRYIRRPKPVSMSPAAEYPALDDAGGTLPWEGYVPPPPEPSYIRPVLYRAAKQAY